MFMDIYTKVVIAVSTWLVPPLTRFMNWYIDYSWKKSGCLTIEGIQLIASEGFVKKLAKLFYRHPSGYKYKYNRNHIHGFYLVRPIPVIVVNFVPDYTNPTHIAIVRHEVGHHVTREKLTDETTLVEWETMADQYALQFVEKETYVDVIKKATLNVFPEELLLPEQVQRLEALNNQ